MNGKENDRKLPWVTVKYCPRICVDFLRESNEMFQTERSELDPTLPAGPAMEVACDNGM